MDAKGVTGMDKESCIERIRDGETEAARLLFSQYGEQIYRNALTATKSKEAARTITRETILELIGSLRTEPEKDGWDLWVESVSARHIEVYGLVERDVETLGSELFEPPAKVEEPPAPVREKVEKPRRRREDTDADLFADDTDEPAPARHGAGSVIVTVLLTVGILLLVWVIVGLLMGFRILPQLDLGYTWFNDHLFRLFW